MATVSFYQSFDMSSFVSWAGEVFNANNVQITTSNGYQNQSFDGNFLYDADEDLKGGTVTRTTYFVGGYGSGATVYQVSSLSLDALTLMSYVNAYNTDNTYDYILSGNDSFTGSGGDEVIKPYAGNDVVNGRDGIDTVVLRGNRDGYSITELGDVEHTLTISGPDGNDTVKNIEYLRFDDQTLAVSAIDTPTTLDGDAGNNVMNATSGDHSIDGHGGTDIVIFTGLRAGYTITHQDDGGYVVIDSQGNDGTDTLSNIERLEFSDKKIALDLTPTGNAGQAMGLIGVLAPIYLTDPSIRGLMISLFDDGASMLQLCELALDIGLLPTDPTQLANTVFQNVIGQPATSEWTDLLTDFIDTAGAASFVATIAGMAINAQLDVYSQTGLEYL